MARKQHYMTRDERLQLEALKTSGLSVAKIAEQLGFCRQTIYNELRRGTYQHRVRRGKLEDRYSADKGQVIHEGQVAMKGRGLKGEKDERYMEFLERKILNDKFSPAAALAAARAEGFTTSVCRVTLYSYIDRGVFRCLGNEDLWEKTKRKKRKEKPERRVAHPKWPSIEERPDLINNREELGHWEMDLVIGKKETGAVLLTLTERVSRYELIYKLPNKEARTVQRLFDKLERKYSDFTERFKSITTDNGSEFLQYDRLVRSIHGGKRFDVYYCHSWSSWEKGTVENHNRMIRRWLPKGTDFNCVSEEFVEKVQDWMNAYPREALNWRTPEQALGA